jgi:hypothetical protein
MEKVAREFPSLRVTRDGELNACLMDLALRSPSKPRDIILDPLVGSGSSLIAIEKTRRHARLFELDPNYVDVTVKRRQDWTGGTATLEGNGRPFSDPAAETADLKARSAQNANSA